jgi:hypothetical protein
MSLVTSSLLDSFVRDLQATPNEKKKVNAGANYPAKDAIVLLKLLRLVKSLLLTNKWKLFAVRG